MHLRRPEWLFPVVGSALSHVSQSLGTRCHALSELGREALDASLGHAQRIESLKGECHIEPGTVGVILPVDSRGHPRREATQQRAAVDWVVDTQQEVCPEVWNGMIPQDDALNVVQLQRGDG